MLKLKFIVLTLYVLSTLSLIGQSQDKNYIRTKAFTNEAGTQYNESIDYIDGVGRVSQSVFRNITPTSKDLITLYEYDDKGRQIKQWLPIISSSNGSYVSPSTIKNPQSIYNSDTRHFQEIVYEASPSDRVLQTYGPGQSWYQNGRSVKTTIFSNNISDSLTCICYTTIGKMEEVQLVKKGNYASNELLVTRIQDEDGKTSFTFTNKTGQTVMNRQVNVKLNNTKEYLDTYYVYDINGRLCYVLTPEIDNSLPIGTLSDDLDLLKKHAYVFKYNKFDLSTHKRLPGSDWVYYVYDSNKKMVMSQDGNMREKNYWLYFMYDNHERVITQSLLYGRYTPEYLTERFQRVNYSNYFPYIINMIDNLFIPFGDNTMTIKDSLYYAVYGNNQYSFEILEQEELEIIDYAYICYNRDWINNPFFDYFTEEGKEEFLENVKMTYDIEIKNPYNSIYWQDDYTIDPLFHIKDDENDPNLSYYYIPVDYLEQCFLGFGILFFMYEWCDQTPEPYVSTIMGPGIFKFRNSELRVPEELEFRVVSGVVNLSDKIQANQSMLTYERIKILDNEASSSYIERAYYYDNKYRPIQVVEKGLNGINRVSYKYDFVGNPTIIVENNSFNNINTEVKTNLTYDHAGRLLTEVVLVNGTQQASMTYTYDELGRLAAKKYAKGSWSTTETMSYNIRDWLTEKSGTYFSMQLRYNDILSSNSTPLYSGGISEWTWQHSGGTKNLYSFKYDKTDRLIGTSQYVLNGSNWTTAPSHYVENGITYDKNGNILTLQRTAAGATVDNLTYGYNGNQLTTLNELVASSLPGDIFVRGSSQQGTYSYDSNGNMKSDSRDNLNFGYNYLNLLSEVKQGQTVKAKYKWSADGMKLNVRDAAGVNGYDYMGSIVYKKSSAGIDIDAIKFSSGVIKKSGSTYQVNYFINDHLGSTRVVVDGSGAIKEKNDYYPFGARHVRSDYAASDNRYRYNGKEIQTTGNVGFLDYGARMYDVRIGRWGTIDPAAELYYNLGSYNYCAGNPIKHIDIDGEIIGTVIGAITGGAIGAYDAYKNGTSIKAGIAEGAVAGAITGAIVDLAVGATIASGGTALGVIVGVGAAAGAVGGAVGAVTGDAAGQLVNSVFEEGKSFTDAIVNLNTDNMLSKASNGAMTGAVGGALSGGVAKGLQVAMKSTTTIQSTMSKNITDVAKTLTEMGADAGTVSKATSKIVTGMGEAAKNTIKTSNRIGVGTGLTTESIIKMIEIDKEQEKWKN